MTFKKWPRDFPGGPAVKILSFHSGGMGSIPSQGTKIPHATQRGPKKEKKKGLKTQSWDFPGGAVVKNPPANAGDTGSIPGPGRYHMPRSN